MNITIEDIVTLNAQGQRSGNEDSLFPEEHLISTGDSLFMVCDGVGGNAGGARASQLVCQHFSHFLLEQGDAFLTKELLGQALSYAEQHLDEYANSYPEFRGMATTLSCLRLTDYGAVIAWVGDSRVLQVREGRVIRQTKDHSLVNALLDYGEITREEVATHPKRHVLLQAVNGTEKPAELDVLYIDDIMPGDYFMLCSDGIIDGLSNRLEEVLSESFSLEQLKYDIDRICRTHTTDNYSMILLQIAQVNAGASEVNEQELAVPVLQENEEPPRSARVDGPGEDSGRRWSPYLLLMFIPLLAFLSWWWWSSLPIALQVSSVGGSGVLIQDNEHTILIDAFPLSDKIQRHQRLDPIRQDILQGKAPFEKVSLFLVSHRPNVELDLAESFLREYLDWNKGVQLHPEILKAELDIGRSLFQNLRWRADELSADSLGFVDRLPSLNSDTSSATVGFSAFVLRLDKDKKLLYAGDPNVDVDYLTALQESFDYVLINEWSLRQGNARRALLSKYQDDQLIVLPSNRPMNNRQKEEMRLVFPNARFLEGDMERVRLK